ncbi:MFS transporter [Aliihoeflea sp. 40Bstr573]|uniref:MFS transporter n=1 Tax=Aliihoeflea sp. 40Bstr573 TaxID=2696467 RepID=UPI0020959CC8|nr:MFS transporter [Aliihoeflea sp. 40Bstr573]
MNPGFPRIRIAVALAFLANGLVIGAWAPQIPALMERLEVTESRLGLLILVFGLGALVAMPWCGGLIARHGSQRPLAGFAVLLPFALPAVVLAPGFASAGLAMFCFGAITGGMDVAMNANAVAVERKLDRAIMSSSHGFWSLGGFAGAAAGGALLQAHGALAQAVVVAAISAAVVVAMLAWSLHDRPAAHAEKPATRWPLTPLPYLLGLAALFGMIPEGAVLDWAALYLQRELGSSVATASLAFAGFSGAMALMRFSGDAIRNRFGAVTTMRVSCLIAGLGLVGAGLSPGASLSIAFFALAGLGIANVVPIAFSAAGNQPGLSPGVGMSVATTMGYSGILVAPSAIGFIGERTGFAPIFVALALVLFTLAALARLVATADRQKVIA